MTDLSERQGARAAIIAALAVLLLIAAASVFPHLRVSWGLGVWGHVSPAIAAVWSVGAIALIICAASGGVRISEEPMRGYWVAALTVVAVAVALYMLFPAKTHFLGDGYQSLGALSDGNLHVKLTAWGEGTIRVWLAHLLRVHDRVGALMVYRLIAVVSGTGFLLTAAFAAGRLFGHSRRSLVFLLGMATGAWTLLYFGYVEQYALFVSAVGVYILVGLMALRGQIGRWWIVALVVIAAALHIFGVVLILPTLYAVMADTATVRRLTRLRWRTKVLLFVAVLGAAIAGAAAIRDQSYFLQYSLLPVFGEELSFDRYAVLSVRHAIDLMNLLLLLLPALPAVLAFAVVRDGTMRPDARMETFLWLAALSSLAAAVVADPKLGMPRDWDLFSFIALPLTALTYLVVLRRSDPVRSALATGMIAIAAFALAGRVTALNIPEVGAARFRDSIMLDHQRHLRSWHHLRRFYQEMEDSTAFAEAGRMWDSLYPERAVFWEGYSLRISDRPRAARLFKRAIEMNSTYADAWVNLGEFYSSYRLFDSAQAVLAKALRLNPDEASAYCNMGVVCLGQRRPEVALWYLEKARVLAPTEATVVYNLALAHLALKQEKAYARYLEEAAALPSAVAGIHTDLGDWYLRQGDMIRAGDQYNRALSKGFDAVSVAERIKRFPGLARYVRLSGAGERH